MKSRYPLIRLEIYQTHEQARNAFKEARTSFGDRFLYRISDLSMSDRHLEIRFVAPDITYLKGCMVDKMVIHFPIDLRGGLYTELKLLINPRTTVENPIVIKGLIND